MTRNTGPPMIILKLLNSVGLTKTALVKVEGGEYFNSTFDGPGEARGLRL